MAKTHNLGRVGPICAKWNSWQWTDARKLLVTPSCNKEDVWYVIRHNKMAFQCVSVTHLHREFCRGYSRCGSLSCNNNFRLFSQNRISILSLKFQLYSQNSHFFFLNVVLIFLHRSQPLYIIKIIKKNMFYWLVFLEPTRKDSNTYLI